MNSTITTTNELYIQEAKTLLFNMATQIADTINNDPQLSQAMIGTLGPINGIIGLKTDDSSILLSVIIQDGFIQIIKDEYPLSPETALIFNSTQELVDFINADNDESIRMFLASKVRLEGNPALFGYFSYVLSLCSDATSSYQEQIAKHQQENQELVKENCQPQRNIRQHRIKGRIKSEKLDKGVRWLNEPFLSEYTLEDFPRLAKFKTIHHNYLPEITAEQGKLLTDFYVTNGFDTQKDGSLWNPMLRTAKAFQYLMENKKAVIRDDDLLAGTVTPNPICGSINQPYTVGWSIWGELNSIKHRELDPFAISDETIETLHKYVFPFWMDKHIQQMWKVQNNYPLSAKINDRMFCFNLWSLVSLNPGSPGFEKILQVGLNGLLLEIRQKQHELSNSSAEDILEQQNSLAAMQASIEGVISYTQNLAKLIARQIDEEINPARKQELVTIHAALQRVPQYPATTLQEALQSIWIMFIAICLDSMDDSITIGRLDQMLQPYFEADLKKLPESKKEEYIKQAIELVGCFFLRITNHRIAAATIASWQNSGAPGVASITIGGVDKDGADVVSDMTYIIIKVAEMLSLDDPDMDARYMVGVNSTDYIRRVAELNYITCGTPSIHNDEAIIRSLCQHGWDIRDAREWVPCGCVEPVIHGKHFASPGDLDSNLMVPLTMAIYNGYHPTAKWDFGPKTGDISQFTDFEQFFKAFEQQFKFIYTEAIQASHQLLKVHQQIMPAPLYSAMLEDCIGNARGMTHGGAKYNSSGAALIGLSDVVDSLLVIKKLVFEEKKFSFQELKSAIDNNFVGYDKIHALINNTVPRFGSGDLNGRQMVERVTAMIADYLHKQDNGRGGHYTTGYRTNNNHTVYGRVSGASPSGRLAGMPYTSGLTPNPKASTNLLDNLNDVASINPLYCDNNYTLNVRLSFNNKDSHKQNVDHIANYVQAYFINGGMQLQINAVDADTLKDAMANPENYPDLIARVSGYTGYFIKMQRDLQLEIIGRTQFNI